MTRKFELLKDSKIEPRAKAGEIVYGCAKPDYGLARDDSEMFGFPCVSVTLKEDGDYPFFVVPQRDLKRLD